MHNFYHYTSSLTVTFTTTTGIVTQKFFFLKFMISLKIISPLDIGWAPRNVNECNTYIKLDFKVPFKFQVLYVTNLRISNQWMKNECYIVTVYRNIDLICSTENKSQCPIFLNKRMLSQELRYYKYTTAIIHILYSYPT